jgi:ubiquinone/menaquinone biosynthesis C-methylase UbiE
MSGHGVHSMLADATHDEMAREHFVISLKERVASDVTPGTRLAFEARCAPQFAKANGREPENRIDVRRALSGDSYYHMASSLKRTTQELMWDSVGGTVERQINTLIGKAKSAAKTKGSLRLDPDIELPRYLTAVDIHCMPGNYTTDLTEGDVFAGALYDRGVAIYMMGGMGPYNAATGESLIAYLKKEHPKFRPTRILDMGCAVGHSTLPYADAFPRAELHAIDVGAATLRYAHGRAESLGKAVHFSQQNAEHTNFPDGHFDLIVSHITLHETSNRAVRNMMRESRRLLAPGGLALHLEVPPFRDKDPFDQYLTDWDTHFNAEPFIGTLHDLSREDLMAQAGFAGDEIICQDIPMQIYSDGTGGNYSHHVGPNLCVFGGRKG